MSLRGQTWFSCQSAGELRLRQQVEDLSDTVLKREARIRELEAERLELDKLVIKWRTLALDHMQNIDFVLMQRIAKAKELLEVELERVTGSYFGRSWPVFIQGVLAALEGK